MTPWFKNVTPHQNVRDSILDESVFAADLSEAAIVKRPTGSLLERPGLPMITYKLLFVFIALLLSPLLAVNAFASSGSNGNNWVLRHPFFSTENHFRSIVYGNNRFVAVGTHGAVATSMDGEKWSSVIIDSIPLLQSIAFGNGRFVAVYDRIVSSVDGLTWSIRRKDEARALYDVTFGKDKFVAVGDSGTILSSPDGVAWKQSPPLTTETFYTTTYGNEKFVAGGYNGTIVTSPDGTVWNKVKSGTDKEILSIAYGNGKFITLFYGAGCMISTDGARWIPAEWGVGDKVNFINNQFVAIGRFISTSSDGAAWKKWTQFPVEGINAAAYGKGRYVIVGDNGKILTSTDCSHWSVRNGLTTANLTSVAFGNGNYVAVGDQGTVLTAVSCSTWKAIDTLPATHLTSVTFGNSLFVAVGSEGSVFTSPRGSVWKKIDAGTTMPLAAVTYSEGIFVAAGYNGTILLSADGLKWMQHDSGTKDCFKSVIAGNGCFVIIGNDCNDNNHAIMTSSDGKTWKKAISRNGYFNSLYFGNGHFIITGYDSDAGKYFRLVSTDGVWWNNSTAAIDTNALLDPNSSLSYSNNLCRGDGCYVMVGEHGMIKTLKATGAAGKKSVAVQTKLAAFTDKVFVGELGQRYFFIMNLTSDGKSLSGNYRYLKQNKSLGLKGKIDSTGVFSLEEAADNGKITGFFSGKITGSNFVAQWRTPDAKKTLTCEGYATSNEKIATRKKNIEETLKKRVGTYKVISGEGSAGANTLFYFSKENGVWTASGSSNRVGYREPDEIDISPAQGEMLDELCIKIDSDCSISLYDGDKRCLNLPITANRFVYFDSSSYLAANISLEQSSDENDYLFPMTDSFTLTYSPTKDEFVLQGNPTLTFAREQR